MSDNKQRPVNVTEDGEIRFDEGEETQMTIRSIGSPKQLTVDVVTMIQILAPSWKEATWFGARNEHQVVVLMCRAFELGFPLTSAHDFFDIISTNSSTRVYLKPKAAWALILRSRLLDGKKSFIRDEKDKCVVRMHRRDLDFGFEAEYTMDMARQAKLVKPNGAWETHPKTMLRWRAIGIVAAIVLPDVLAGLQMSTDNDQFITEIEEVNDDLIINQ